MRFVGACGQFSLTLDSNEECFYSFLAKFISCHENNASIDRSVIILIYKIMTSTEHTMLKSVLRITPPHHSFSKAHARTHARTHTHTHARTYTRTNTRAAHICQNTYTTQHNMHKDRQETYRQQTFVVSRARHCVLDAQIVILDAQNLSECVNLDAQMVVLDTQNRSIGIQLVDFEN